MTLRARQRHKLQREARDWSALTPSQRAAFFAGFAPVNEQRHKHGEAPDDRGEKVQQSNSAKDSQCTR